MVNNYEDKLDLIFHALSDPTRRAMLSQLSKKECTVTELVGKHKMTLAGVSKHLKVLEKARFVEKTKNGRSFCCRANLQPLNQVYELLEDLGSFWRKQLDSLEQYFNNENLKKENILCHPKKKQVKHQK